VAAIRLVRRRAFSSAGPRSELSLPWPETRRPSDVRTTSWCQGRREQRGPPECGRPRGRWALGPPDLLGSRMGRVRISAMPHPRLRLNALALSATARDLGGAACGVPTRARRPAFGRLPTWPANKRRALRCRREICTHDRASCLVQLGGGNATRSAISTASTLTVHSVRHVSIVEHAQRRRAARPTPHQAQPPRRTAHHPSLSASRSARARSRSSTSP
jgi:hypothetical protein